MEIPSSGFWEFRKKSPISHRDHPLQLAEELPCEAAEEGFRHYSETKTPEGLLQSSWRMVEYALARDSPLDNEMRRMYISYYAPQLLADVLAMSKEDNPLHHYQPDYSITAQHASFHHALTLGAYLPLFNKRATSQPITHQDVRDLHASMCTVLQEELSLGDTGIQDTRLSENVTSLLASRTGQPEYTLYLASPREEASHDAFHNHDRYFVSHGSKAPVQIKIGATAMRYSPQVSVIDIEGLLRFAAEKAQLDISDSSSTVAPAVRQAAQILAYEYTDEIIYPNERNFLNIASQGIVKLYQTHRQLDNVA